MTAWPHDTMVATTGNAPFQRRVTMPASAGSAMAA
jgi:hypothetical protein